FMAGTPLGSMMALPAEINCAPTGMGAYACGFGPLSGGMASAANTNSTFFPAMPPLIPAKTVVKVKYTGGAMLGTYDSLDNLKATDPLTVMEDLTKIKYD